MKERNVCHFTFSILPKQFVVSVTITIPTITSLFPVASLYASD